MSWASFIPNDVVLERRAKMEKLRELKIVGVLEGYRVVVWNPDHGYSLYSSAFFGKPMGIRKPKLVRYKVPYELSFYDSLYLLKRGIIRIVHKDREISCDELRKVASSVIDDFDPKYMVYEDLRDSGFVVKPGLKYGADFVVYVYGPGIDHSPFVVSVFSKNIRLRGQDFLRSGRLSWSVRKRWVMACVYDGSIKYFIFEWDKDLSL